MSSNHSKYRRALDRIQFRFRRARPGSVLILVVALLVLMALIGTAYMSTAQIDRYSAQQNAFNTEVDLLLQGVVNMVDGRLVADLYSGSTQTAATFRQPGGAYVPYTTTGTAPSPSVAAGITPQPWLGDRIPVTQLMQTLGGGTTTWAPWTTNTNTAANATSNFPLWAFVSAPPTGSTWQFESPYINGNPATYTSRTNLQPGYIPVPSGSTSVLYPALYDPATNATYMAADADGDGIADTGLFRLPVGEINGVTYYAGVRIIDNAAAVNASVAYAWPFESFRYPPTMFLPTSVDLNTLLVLPGERPNLVNGYRMGFSPNAVGGTVPSKTPVDDLGNTRADFEYFNILTNEWEQLGRRLDNPGMVQRPPPPPPASQAAIVPYQALPPGEGALMARKFILRDPSVSTYVGSPSILEQYIPSSVALSSVATNTGYYQATPFTNATPWFNTNFNYAVPATVNNSPSINTLPIRALLTARNGVSNFVPNKFAFKQLWSGGATYNFGDWVTGSDKRTYVCINAPLPGGAGVATADPTAASSSVVWAAEPWSNAPTKTSANTATFPQLWAGYWSAMWDSSLANPNAGAGGVPVGADTRMFRNALRSSGAGASALTSRQMLQLRAALAAVNTIGLREADAQIYTGFGDVKSRNITINADTTVAGSLPYNAQVFSGEANPYITEVYADAANQYIAVEIYNPFQWKITLANWQLATIARTGGTPGAITAVAPAWTAGTAPIIPAQGYAVVVSSLVIPTSASMAPSATGRALVAVPTLTNAFNNELVLLRPRQAAGSSIFTAGFPLTSCSSAAQSPTTGTNGSNYNDQGDPARDYPLESGLNPLTLVPVDSYDFTGLVAGAPGAHAVWHYVRPNDLNSGKAWHFVYPGRYFPTDGVAVTNSNDGTGANAPNVPRQEGTTVGPSSTQTSLLTMGAADGAALTSPFREFAIQIANTDFGGPYKLYKQNPPGSTNDFPYGHFPRNGDLLQVPFIGAYTITDPTTGALVEMNPVTMDAAFADDGDGIQGENVGRFCPINAADISPAPPAPAVPPNDFLPPIVGGTPANYNPAWRYHWAMQLFDYLTVQSPQDDYFPDVDPNHWVYWSGLSYVPLGTVIPVANANPSIANASIAPPNNPVNATEDTVPVNGLININTASWKVLATLPLVLQASNATTTNQDLVDAVNTAKLAQAIVYFRDVDDGSGAIPRHPHGPFTSIYELNLVPNFRTAMGTVIPNGGPLNDFAGDITPYYVTTSAQRVVGVANTSDNVVNDFEQQNMVVNRISNMITTRSDSFTVYIIVQGFRNAGTAAPELVVQRRAAFIADRSSVTPTNSSVSSLTVPVN